MNYSFEEEGNRGVLFLETHFNIRYKIPFEKKNHHIFRVGGTAVNSLVKQSVKITKAPVFGDPTLKVDDEAIVLEYYPLDMEGKEPQRILVREFTDDMRMLFINVDLIDGGGNLIKRFRVSPYFGTVRVMDDGVY